MVQAVLARPRQADEREGERPASRRHRGGHHRHLRGVVLVPHGGLQGPRPADALADFYLDLDDERFAAPFAVFHQRFSTNTLSTWERAQPFRTLCHNGEINALWGNQNRMRGRAELGTVAAGLGHEELFGPVLDVDDSDSGNLDAAVELLMRAGATPPRHGHAHARGLGERARPRPRAAGFYRYHSALMEPWDGPAGVVFTDGLGVGARLDRNGLRPLRYQVCEDGLVAVCSEVGASTCGGTVGSGGVGWGPARCCSSIPPAASSTTRPASSASPPPALRPLGRRRPLPAQPRRRRPRGARRPGRPPGHARPHQEDLSMVVRIMATEAHEPTFSMGDDSPLPNLAPRARPGSHYLRQRFAQVSNPPIDPLRERLVMSLRTLLGPRQPLLTETAEAARLLTLPSFFMYPSGVDGLRRAARHRGRRRPRRHVPGG